MTETATVPTRHLDLRAGGAPAPARRDGRAQWAGLVLLLLGTAAAYLWNLSANGWANTYYAAAVEAGASSWKSFFFGSLDAADAVTVDKTPASLWPMELSARLFGMNSWSMLVPQVLLGVASVAVLWAVVRRHFGANAGLLAGALLALTPVAALMFRYDNPDALLVLLMLAAVWAMSRALGDGRWRWLVLCGLFVGLGFLAKQLQVLLVVPPLALTYLLFGPPRLRRRIGQVLAAAAGMVAGAGWWVLIAQCTPADERPYFGGSQHNSIIELTLGYNGLDRLGGGETGGPGGGGSPFGGARGLGRLFSDTVGGQIAWLIPAALIVLVASLVALGRVRRTDPRRALLVLFGLWGVVTGLVFSLMSGIFHEYYTVALAPAVAGTLAAGLAVLWPRRRRWWIRLTLAGTLTATAVTAWLLLARTPDFVPWLKWAVAAAAVLAVAGLLAGNRRDLATMTVLAALFAGIVGPAAYTVETLHTAHTGSTPTAGPQTARGHDAGGGTSGPGGADGAPRDGSPTSAAPDGSGSTPAAMPGAGGGAVSQEVVALLDADHASHRWVAATVGSQAQGGYQLAVAGQVMAIGGFSGSDPTPTLEQFQRYVADGDIHYFLAGGSGGGPGGSGTTEGSRITAWVREHYTAVEVDGVTLYDLTRPAN
ncbi:glycosyltransferase family 39 protein [Nocardia thailandica]